MGRPLSRSHGLSQSRMRTTATAYLLLAPMLVGIAVFVLYPMLCALVYSFQKTNGISGSFRGIMNYRWLFRDKVFWTAMGNTIYMAILSVISGISVCFLLASMINSLSRGKNFFKSVYFLPNVVSMIAVATLFIFFLNPTENGPVNYFLKQLGIGPISFFVNTQSARESVVLMGLWKSIGYDTILFLAGLQSVSREMYEAASVDGANGFRRWWHITIPSMKPIFAFMTIMYTINALKRFTDVYRIGGTAGNPGEALTTIMIYIYRNAWVTNNVGVASAAAYMLFLLSMIFTVINYRFFGVGKTE